MSRINPLSREISAKIVYYGPGLSGKTTTLQYIHDHVRPAQRGELISLATEGDRTIFFDFLPLSFERVRGLSVRLQLYTVPGQVYYAATRKLVLNGADAVVFVADSQPEATERNRESLEDLRGNLVELGYELGRFPFVLQYNKRDIPGVLSFDALQAELNPGPETARVPAFETCAPDGTGVFKALKEIVRLTIRDLKARRDAASRPVREMSFDEEAPAGGAIEAELERAAQLLSARGAPAYPEDTQPAPPPASEPSPTSPEHLAREAVGPGAAKPTVSFSFGVLFEGALASDVGLLQAHLAQQQWARAVRLAAQVVHEMLVGLPGATESDGPTARAMALGLDGREFLRLSRLASTPDEAVNETDALFALHLAVAARLKLDRL